MTSAVTVPALGLGPAEDLHRAGRGDVADVQPGADVPGEQHVAGDDRLLGDGGPAGQPEPAGDRRPRSSARPRSAAAPAACWAMTPSNALTYSSARRISAGVGDAVPSSENTRTRAAESAIAPSSASCSPASPTVTAPTGRTSHAAGLAAEPPDLLDDAGGVGDRVGVRHRVHGGVAAERGGAGAGLDGLGVLAAGLAQVGVQVDQAGQRDQAAGVDRPRRPAAVRSARRSRRSTAVARAARRRRSADVRRSRTPSDRADSLVTARSRRGSPPPSSRYSTAIRTVTPLATCSTIIERGRVGDLGGDLHAAVHRAGVHDDGVVGQRAPSGGVQPVAAAVLALGREERGAHPLALDPQHHHDVGLGQHRVEVVGDLAGQAADADRQQRRRRDQRDLGAERVQQQHVGAGHPAVQDVADDGDPHGPRAGRAGCRIVKASSSAWVGCSWVPSPALTTLPSHPVGEPVRRAGGAVPDDDRVGAHRLEGQRGVLERLALGDAGALGGEVDDVGGQPLGRQPRRRCGCGWSPRRTG